jgi:hypothetical protein
MNIKLFAVRTAFTAVSTLAIVGSAIAQNGNISVYVDGNPVAFNGVGPQEVNGRVLVPLRGVLEKLGAYVGWDPAGQMVTAQRGDTSIDLRIGSREARVNNQPVALDVPAEIYRGSTMVPLRFVSEALGADVRWDATQYAVMIDTSSGARSQDINNLPPPVFAIQSLDADREGTVNAGTNIHFTMRGTPGGVATLAIPGIQDRIPMHEVSSGVYVADWIVPGDQGGLDVSHLVPVGRLRFGSSEKTFQMASQVSSDQSAPSIRALTPQNQSSVTVSRPTISAVFDDQHGSGVDPRSVRLLLDGVDVSSDATITERSISYVPAVGVGPGRHDVTLMATDSAGNKVTKRWSFRVNGQLDHVIQSFTAEGLEGARPGDVVRFTLRAEPNGTATFSLGDIVTDKPMDERSPGEYVGVYTIRRGDDLANLAATARFIARDGQVFNVDSRDQSDVNGGTLDAPSISLPRSDEPLRNPLVVEGRAPAGTRVRVHVDYSTNVRGVAKLTGQVADVTVVSDANGRFRTNPINMDNFLTGRGTAYTITATTLGTNGRHSEASTVTITR